MFFEKKIIDGGSVIPAETSSPFFVIPGGLDEASFETTLQPQEISSETDPSTIEESVEIDNDEFFDELVTEEIPAIHNIALEQGRKPKLLSEHQLKVRALIIHHRNERANQLARKKTFRQRIGAIVLSFGVLAAGVQVIPQALGQPSIESTTGRAIEAGFINELGGTQIEQQAAEQAAVDSETPSAFIIANEDSLKNIQAGDTFVPEQYLPSNTTNLLDFIQTPEGQLYQQKALNILKAEVEVLGIKEIRMGIRWSNTIMADGAFSLAFYKPYLDFLNSYKNPKTAKNVVVTLSVGPLKSPGWPETFLPDPPEDPSTVDTSLIPLGKLPPAGAEISPNMPAYPDLTSKAERWLNIVMQQVSLNYSSINNFQPDNEPLNPFGPEQWTMSSAWEKDELKIILQYKPNANFLINFAGTANIAGSVDIKNPPNLVKAISETITLLKLEQKFSEQSVVNEMLNYRSELMSTIKQAKGKGNVIIGTDYYHLTSNTPLPIKVQLNGKNYEVWVDTDTLINITENLNNDKNPWAKLDSNQITEMQNEPWMPFTSPGNNPKELLFALSRALDVLPSNKPSTIGFWQIGPLLDNLMYNPKAFYSNIDPKKMSDPSGQFTANDQTILEIVAATTGVSTVKTVNGKKVVDNTTIDNFINQYIDTGNSGLNISTP